MPEVAVEPCYGTPSLKVRKKMFARLKEDGETVVFVLENLDEQQLLVAQASKVYFVTPHYEGWPAVLARLPKLTKTEAKFRLERAWRLKAPKKLLATKPPA